MRARLPILAALTVLPFIILPVTLAAPAAWAQTKPMHSGHIAHGAPQMRVHGSGLHHPNRPHYHHHPGFAGYRPTHHHHHYHHHAHAPLVNHLGEVEEHLF